MKLESILGKKPHHKPIIFTDNDNSFCLSIRAQVGLVLETLKDLNKRLSKRLSTANKEVRQTIDQSLETQAMLDFYVSDEKYSMSGIAWSKVLGLPSLEIVSPLPGNVMRRYYSDASDNKCKTLFTSATLSNGRSKSFEQFRTEIGCRTDEISVQAQHEPDRFGFCEYVLTDLSIPKPVRGISHEDSTEFSGGWLQHVVNVIEMASTRGNVVCLTVSFSEALQIGSLLDLGCPIHIHSPGQRLSKILAQFEEKGGILISPSVWEGVSIRNSDGEQHFTELVVSRIPYPPPEPFKEKALISYLCMERNRTIQQAKSILWAQGNINATRKLRQGFGRLIRHADDVGRIYICDPRFVSSESTAISRQDRGLTNAIPSRFWDAYCAAMVFRQEDDTKIAAPVEKELSEEVLAWL
jgi:ATP-dependent DNA helicase DinG